MQFIQIEKIYQPKKQIHKLELNRSITFSQCFFFLSTNKSKNS